MTDTTRKMAVAPRMNEKEYAKYVYDKAKEKIAPGKNPTQDDIDAFIQASIKYKYTLSAYELGRVLLEERAFQLKTAVRSVSMW